MRKSCAVVVLALLPAGSITSHPATRPATSPATQPAALVATIDKAIKLLEAQKHEELIRLLIEPKELDRWLESHSMQSVIDGFKGRKAEDLLLILRQARDRTPVIDQDGKRATFKLDGAVRKDVDFARVGDKWYLKGQ